MKFTPLFVAILGAIGVAAQASFIGHPPAGSSLLPGQTLTVQVVRPNSIQGSIEVGMVIGLLDCQFLPCPPPNAQVGTILFNGDFNPQLHEKPGMPYQNFTVTIPSAEFLPNNVAQLGVVRFHLIGAGPSPVLESNNVTLRVVH
ncbi:hypothetical protein NLJ89_g7698 [Agrocybe chaxingu]|uniref:Uncharacterized protein n=1 Tax=Agrocybe chaxingu TaxID=84603 RepID=A0A9W8MUT4_9AGAR|nr:hypothetical protein NLJ89_g7698 [Agrocybe chaxingu]